MNETELKALLSRIRPADSAAKAAAKERQSKLAKPPGSLGALEEISVRLAGITGRVCNRIEKTRIVVFAADNGIVAEGVASTPQCVTLAQTINMTRGKTGMSAIARDFGIDVEVIDVGINSDSVPETILDRKLGFGTANFSKQPAMTRSQAVDALAIGIEAAERAHNSGADALGIGEMGIGNTTTSAAVLACLLDLPVESVTGRGSGLTDEGFALKKRVISDAVALHRPNGADVLDVLSKVGGFDIAAMTGAFIGCALFGLPAVADGLISVTAALAAVRLCKTVRDFVFLSHASYEIGYRAAAAELGMEPWLNLNMRLGEGSGCPVAFQVMRAACAAMNDMATFEEASINDNYLENIRNESAFCVKTV